MVKITHGIKMLLMETQGQEYVKNGLLLSAVLQMRGLFLAWEKNLADQECKILRMELFGGYEVGSCKTCTRAAMEPRDIVPAIDRPQCPKREDGGLCRMWVRIPLACIGRVRLPPIQKKKHQRDGHVIVMVSF